MPMTKAEQKMVHELRVRCALRMEPDVPPDVQPPKYGEPVEERIGYEPNFHTAEVRIALITPRSHTATWVSRDKDPLKTLNDLSNTKKSISMSQGTHPVFSKRINALRAIRYAMQMKFARELAQIDEFIDEELKSPHPLDEQIAKFNVNAEDKLLASKSAGYP